MDQLPEKMTDRARWLISWTWEILANKIGHGLIEINKEASLQLQYSYFLQQGLNLIKLKKEEVFTLEMETGVPTDGRMREVDVLLTCQDSKSREAFAIEMKCYRKMASSGKPRGASDIFMKDVYKDLELLERYCHNEVANYGVSLVMTDYENLVNPKRKDSKKWDYDISDGLSFEGIKLNTPIGGKAVSLQLEKSYSFNWKKFGAFWFLEVEGK